MRSDQVVWPGPEVAFATGRNGDATGSSGGMFTMFALTRMGIRVAVVGALIATVMSVAAAFSERPAWESVESHAETALDWLGDLLGRLGDIDPSVGDITLADLTSPRGWIDLGAGLLGGGEQPAEVDPVDVARIVDGDGFGLRVDDLTLRELADLQALGVDLNSLGSEGLGLDGLDLDALGPAVPGVGD